MKSVAIKEFKAPIRWEGSWGASKFTEPVDHTMELFFEDELVAQIEWVIDAIDHVEHIGLWFDRDEHGKRVLTDYDGVFSMPHQAVEFLRDFGITVPDDVV